MLTVTSTVFIKLGCWVWCRLIKNSSVQALAQDAMTDVVFSIFSSTLSPLFLGRTRYHRMSTTGMLCSAPYTLYPAASSVYNGVAKQESVIFPMIGSFFRIWWLDALGGLLLSVYVIVNWSRTTAVHIRHLTGAAASPQDRNVSVSDFLYITSIHSKVTVHLGAFFAPLIFPVLATSASLVG